MRFACPVPTSIRRIVSCIPRNDAADVRMSSISTLQARHASGTATCIVSQTGKRRHHICASIHIPSGFLPAERLTLRLKKSAIFGMSGSDGCAREWMSTGNTYLCSGFGMV